MFDITRFALILFGLLSFMASSVSIADEQLDALTNKISSLQQQRKANQTEIEQLQQALAPARASQAPYQKALTTKLAALEKAKQAAGKNPSSYAQAEVNNAKFKAALAQRKFDQSQQKIDQINNKINQLKQQQLDSRSQEKKLKQRIADRKEELQFQAQRQKELLQQKAKKAAEEALAAKKVAQKPAAPIKAAKAPIKKVIISKAKPKKPSLTPIQIPLYTSNPSDTAKAKRLSRHYAWLQKQKQRNAPEDKAVTLTDQLTLLSGQSKKQAITLKLHANKNYAGQIALAPGKHILRLGNNKWVIMVPKNLERQTHFFIVDYHDETLPDLHWYHSAM